MVAKIWLIIDKDGFTQKEVSVCSPELLLILHRRFQLNTCFIHHRKMLKNNTRFNKKLKHTRSNNNELLDT